MFASLARKIFGTVNDRTLRALQKEVVAINALEESLAPLSNAQLTAKTAEFKERFADGESLDSMLVEAFAVVREASKRILGMRHFDSQLVGGIVLHRGQISEMRTGEGKTLVGTLAVYLNALSGEGVHVVTVNDYLASRDAEWMGKLYKFLGLTVGCITHDLSEKVRKEIYACDITYGTNNEFGFDYLRDNMRFTKAERVQRGYAYAIVDEVDSILIDEARTPLVISGPTDDNSDLYVTINALVPEFTPSHYELDEKAKNVILSEEGMEYTETLLKERGLLAEDSSLYSIESVALLHHVNQALRAHKNFFADGDYIVKDKQVILIDEFTGRMMEGRRFSDGLHQALEAKENVPIQNENQTLASITFQNYFRMYHKLAGMTGTAMTEADEFQSIYHLSVVAIPPNKDVQRIDADDEIYRTAREKYEAITDSIVEAHAKKQPVLVGTISIEKSEFLSKMLKKKNVPHQILNAKQHEREASIIAQAGRLGAVTIATNMAGRGTDIQLGGNPELMIEEAVKKAKKNSDPSSIAKEVMELIEHDKQAVLEAGGLYVLGTERHESRRIDNQLRGRSGRQGDAGYTKFYLSLEDDLMRIFGTERISSMLSRLGLKDGEAITHPWISKAIEKAQNRVEQHHFDARKNLLKFDDVMNDQRKVIYEQRVELMDAENVHETVEDMRNDVLEDLMPRYIPPGSYLEQWNLQGLEAEAFRLFALRAPVAEWAKEEGVAEEEISERLVASANEHYKAKQVSYGPQIMTVLEKKILLMTLDQLWKDHLLSLDCLKQGINLRAYGQKNPLNEYKREAFLLFEYMLSSLREEVTSRLSHVELATNEQDAEAINRMGRRSQPMHEGRQDLGLKENEGGGAFLAPASNKTAPEDRDANDPLTWGKVKRNEACPCGSGKKYKHCHGVVAA